MGEGRCKKEGKGLSCFTIRNADSSGGDHAEESLFVTGLVGPAAGVTRNGRVAAGRERERVERARHRYG